MVEIRALGTVPNIFSLMSLLQLLVAFMNRHLVLFSLLSLHKHPQRLKQGSLLGVGVRKRKLPEAMLWVLAGVHPTVCMCNARK